MMCWIRLFGLTCWHALENPPVLEVFPMVWLEPGLKKLPDFSFGIGFVVDGVAGDVADGGVDYDDAGADSHLVQS